MDGDEFQKDGAQTALIPKYMFGDKELEVGKTCKFKVVATFEDDVEVEYAGSEDKKKEKDDPDYSEPTMDSQIDAAAMEPV